MKYLAVIFVLVASAWAGNCDGSNRCYVLKSASGTGTGASWTNACSDFTVAACSTLARGTTYYVGTGTYTGPQHISTAVSGTTLITIKGATTADHGVGTGWLDSFSVRSADGGAQAKFSWFDTAVFFGFSTFWVDTSYVTIDGNTGTDGSPSTYGFASPAITSCASHDWAAVSYGGSGDASNNTLAHFSFDAAACADTDQVVRTLLNESTTGNYNNNTTSHVYCNKTQDCVTYHWSNGNTAATGNLIEYMWVPVGGAWDGDTNHHGEQFNMFCQDGTTIRYSTVLSGTSTGLLVANDATIACDSTVGFNNGKIYGNVFGGNNGGNGVITSTGASGIKNTVVYNNTIVNVTTGPWFGPLGFNTSNTVKNNIVWNSPCSYGAASPATHTHNSFLSCTDTAPTETSGQVASLDPFVASGSNNYHLTNGTGVTAGDSTIGATYNTDIDGVTRGTDGTWDRGAYEFVSGALATSGLMQGGVVIRGTAVVK
jgi:hypothetical protein